MSDSKKIEVTYSDLIKEPQTYLAASYPLSEVDWYIIRAFPISEALIGTGLASVVVIVNPVRQYLSGIEVDTSQLYVAGVGLLCLIAGLIKGSFFNNKRKSAIKRIDAHWSVHGVSSKI